MPDSLEIHAQEMSTTRMHHGEPHLTIWFSGPRGGGTGMMRLDRVEADKLLKALAGACAALEEAATAAVYAGWRRPKTINAKSRAKRWGKHDKTI